MVRFAEINQAPPPYSMLQYIGRVDWFQNLCEVLSKKLNEKKTKKRLKKPGIFFILNSLFLIFGICQMVL